MYTKQQLEQMEIPQLMAVASEYGVKVSPNDSLETTIYAILDAAALKASQEETAGSKRKRTRINKKETDHVYSVNGKEGENLDTRAARKKVEQPQLFSDLPPVAAPQEDAAATPVVEEVQETPAPKKRRTKKAAADAAKPAATSEPATASAESAAAPVASEQPAATETSAEAPVKPKKRGRKSKAELAEIAAAKAAAEVAEQAAANVIPEVVEGQATAIPEAESADAAPESDAPDKNLLEQLQEHMAQHNQEFQPVEGLPVDVDAVWEGDPADGTDFITVVDLPVEDQGAIPTLDIFDRPVVQHPEPVYQPAPQPQRAAQQQPPQHYDFDGIITANGVLEIVQDGYGFLRSSDYNYLSSPDDVYVTAQQIKKYSLKTGDVVDCNIRPPHEGEKYFALSSINMINGRNPSEVRDRVSFEHLTPLFPDKKFNLTGDPATTNPSTRIVDLFSPIGKGQRALIVAQPKTGKTILMKDIANAIAANHPEAYIMMLLIDERPEEVTDMSRTVNAEVIASTFDEPADRHVKIAGIVLEKAKRMVECGHDVVIFLDSITRLARAYNTVSPASGKVLTGGVDANALQKPKRFFGAARNIEGGGSLTIIATALVDTGSKMDEVIFEEFKGTGNSEIQLDRMLSNKRIFPSLNLVQSSTRRDDLLQDQLTLNRMWIVRKFISEMNPIEAMNTLRDRLVQSRNNEEFLMSMNG